MNKRSDWPEALALVVESRRDWPFAWGKHDCCTFAAACVEAQTGDNPLADLVTWKDERSALSAIKSAGGLEWALDARFKRIANPNFMQRGDLALVENRGRDLVAVCTGLALVAPGESGLDSFRTFDARAAWRVA